MDDIHDMLEPEEKWFDENKAEIHRKVFPPLESVTEEMFEEMKANDFNFEPDVKIENTKKAEVDVNEEF